MYGLAQHTMENQPAIPRFDQGGDRRLNPSEVDIPHFVGRLGGQGATAVTRSASNETLLKLVPDAAPLTSLKDALDLYPLLTVGLWKSALMEGIGKRTTTTATTYITQHVLH